MFRIKRLDIKMFRCNKKVLVVAMKFFVCNVLKVNPLKCVSMNSQECWNKKNVAVVLIISMVHMQTCVSLMLLKT